MNSGSSTWHPKSIHFSNILRTKRNCPILPQPVNVNRKNPDPKLSQLILISALCSTQFFIRIPDGNLKPLKKIGFLFLSYCILHYCSWRPLFEHVAGSLLSISNGAFPLRNLQHMICVHLCRFIPILNCIIR